MNRPLLFLSIICSLTICLDSFAYKRTLSLMTYNLENLFDTLHDEGKEDYTFLPLVRKERDPKIRSFCYKIPNPHYRNECLNLDWSAPVLLNKIRNISKIIRESNNGSGPDFLVLQEVENYNVLQKLINLGLVDEGYKELVIIRRLQTKEVLMWPLFLVFHLKGISNTTI